MWLINICSLEIILLVPCMLITMCWWTLGTSVGTGWAGLYDCCMRFQRWLYKAHEGRSLQVFLGGTTNWTHVVTNQSVFAAVLAFHRRSWMTFQFRGPNEIILSLKILRIQYPQFTWWWPILPSGLIRNRWYGTATSLHSTVCEGAFGGISSSNTILFFRLVAYSCSGKTWNGLPFLVPFFCAVVYVCLTPYMSSP